MPYHMGEDKQTKSASPSRYLHDHSPPNINMVPIQSPLFMCVCVLFFFLLFLLSTLSFQSIHPFFSNPSIQVAC